eukprot:gene14198-21767_t
MDPKPWPSGWKAPLAGVWDTRTALTTLESKCEVLPSRWTIASRGVMIELVLPTGEAYPMEPVKKNPTRVLTKPYKYVALPELFEPDWFAISFRDVYWVQRDDDHHYSVLIQKLDLATGSPYGVRKLLTYTQTEQPPHQTGEGVDTALTGRPLKQVDYTSKPWARAAVAMEAAKPWWYAPPPPLPAAPQAPPTVAVPPSFLPDILLKTKFCFSGYAWVDSPGWVVGSTDELRWFVLYGQSLFLLSEPQSESVEEVELLTDGKMTVIEQIQTTPPANPGGPTKHSVTVIVAEKSVTFLFRTQWERDAWVAMIDVTIAQLAYQKAAAAFAANGGYLPEAARAALQPYLAPSPSMAANLSAYINILLHQPFPKSPVPCVSPVVNLETLPGCAMSAYVMLELGKGGTGWRSWFAEGHRRRFTTVHDGWLSVRDEKESSKGVVVLPMMHAAISKTEVSASVFEFTVGSPFLSRLLGGPLNLWFESRTAYNNWISGIDRSIRYANACLLINGYSRGSPSLVIQTLDTESLTAHSGDVDVLREKMTSGVPFLITRHGVEVPSIGGPLAFPHAQNSAWRALVSARSPPVVGCEDFATTWVGEAALQWVPDDTQPLAPPPVAPWHAVVRGRQFHDQAPVPRAHANHTNVVRDCLLPASAILGESVMNAYPLDKCLKVTSCLLSLVPRGTEYLLRSDGEHQWVAAMSGSVLLTLFPSTCYSLSTAAFPSCRASSHNQPLPANWQATDSPLHLYPAAQVTVEAGQA